jgi:hypothetical protein
VTQCAEPKWIENYILNNSAYGEGNFPDTGFALVFAPTNNPEKQQYKPGWQWLEKDSNVDSSGCFLVFVY